jgi:hypothetical protein
MRDFSATALWAKIMIRIEAFGASLGIRRKPVSTPLPDSDAQRLRERLAPLASQLEELRRDTCAKLDKQARILLPSVAVVTIALFVLIGGGAAALLALPRLVIVVLIAVTVAWLLLQHAPYRAHKRATRIVFAQAVAQELSGFDYTPDPEIALDDLRALAVFPHVSAAQGWDMMRGERDGLAVSICRLNINYHYRRSQRRESHRKSNLHAICVEVAASPLGAVHAVLLPGMVDIRIHRAITRKHGLEVVPTGDATLDSRFKAFLSDPAAVKALTEPPMREALSELGRRADAPLTIFSPGRTVALFPLPGDIFVPFAPRPYWEPVDLDRFIQAYACDLADLHSRLMAVIALQSRQLAQRGH